MQGLSIIKNKFDFIYSAHLIEHQVCLLKHLNQIEKILKKNMFYFLVVPDSRYCFDKFKKLSTISDVFDQFYSKSQSVRLKNLIDTYYLDTHNDADIHWKNKVNKNNLLPPFSIERIIDAIDVYKKNTYIDVHSWHFTPDSFSKILNILFITDYTTLKIERIYPTRKNTQEFFAILKNV